ncbi:MAG: hypothetical protein V5B40_09290 [Candidatus Accumulibacter meliphilus]|jgi:hypothetical protein|uniref:hypothetical protein n=1 Tax=Candidatus Accumulibacter meliphilus TaxID=2211374 RepID=UPI002FC3BDCD
MKRRLNGFPDRHGGHGNPPDRRTAGRWWEWLQKKSLLFEFHLRARCAELGRAGDFDTFGRRVFESIGLAQAMILLDQQMICPLRLSARETGRRASPPASPSPLVPLLAKHYPPP